MKAIIIGRDKDKCDYVVNDPFVSRAHLQIVKKDDDTYIVFDLNSSTGTYVNGKKIKKETNIYKYDIIKIGNTVLRWNKLFDDNTNSEDQGNGNIKVPPPLNKSQSSVITYASFWQRLGAYIVDYIIIVIVVFILLLLFFLVNQDRYYSDDEAEAIGNAFVFFIGWLYYSIFESSIHQATPGKKLLRIKVTDIDGNRIGFAQATGRYFGKIISSLILLIGFLMPLWTDKKQALHDQMAGCLVVDVVKE